MKTILSIEKHRDGEISRLKDTVIVEKEITLVAGGREFHLMCTPDHLEALGVGFLFNAGLILQAACVESVQVKGDTITIELPGMLDMETRSVRTSGCLGMGIETSQKIARISVPVELEDEEILGLSQRLNEQSVLFKETGGTHASLMRLADGTEYFVEDIGRHNTLDKLTGAALLDGSSMEGAVIATTGRISSEMVIKAARSGVGMLISRSAPTDRAVTLAQNYQIVLIGFARGDRYNRYTLLENAGDR